MLPVVCVNMSIGPETGYAATGVPRDNASIITIPNVSVLDGKANTFALMYSLARSVPCL